MLRPRIQYDKKIMSGINQATRQKLDQVNSEAEGLMSGSALKKGYRQCVTLRERLNWLAAYKKDPDHFEGMFRHVYSEEQLRQAREEHDAKMRAERQARNELGQAPKRETLTLRRDLL